MVNFLDNYIKSKFRNINNSPPAWFAVAGKLSEQAVEKIEAWLVFKEKCIKNTLK